MCDQRLPAAGRQFAGAGVAGAGFTHTGDFGREAIRLEEAFPEAGFSEASIVDGQRVQFAGPGFEDEFLFANFSDDPVFVDFVGIQFASGGWADIFGARTWRTAILFPRVDDPIIGMKRIAHRSLSFVTVSAHDKPPGFYRHYHCLSRVTDVPGQLLNIHVNLTDNDEFS
ncbi:hypothetical protein SH449x_001917 [Pirellulaceae bacterium SH449]